MPYNTSKFDIAIPLLGIYPTEMLTYVQKDVCEEFHCSLLKNWEIPYMLSIEDWVNKF